MADPTASDWVVSDYDRIRLISSGTGEASQPSLGIQIELQPGWKTYWRAPGETGIPPRFDWAKSRNLGSIEVLWPSPRRYSSYGLETIGYKDEVVFPLVAEKSASDQALTIDVVVDYAVCRDICVPLQAQLVLDVPQGTASDAPYAGILRRFGDRVPKAGGTTPGSGAPSLVNLTLQMSDGREYLRATIGGLANSDETDLFVEAGDEFGFGPPEVAHHDTGGVVEFRIPVQKYRKRADLGGKSVSLTLVKGARSFEWRSPVAVD